MSTVPSTVLMKTLTQVHIIPLRSVLSSSHNISKCSDFRTSHWATNNSRLEFTSPGRFPFSTTRPLMRRLRSFPGSPKLRCSGTSWAASKAFHKRRCTRSSNKLPHRPPSPSWPPSTATGWAVADATSVSKLKASGTGEWRRAKVRESNEHRASIGKKCNKVNKLLPAGIQNGYGAETFTSYKFRNMQFLTSKSLGAPKASTFEHLHPNQTYHVTQKKGSESNWESHIQLGKLSRAQVLLLPETWKKWTMEWS